jgi:phosphocarrier protein
MSEDKQTRTVTVNNPQGLHARPADLFVRTALRFAAKIEVIKEGYRVDGKSMLSVLTLAAPQGTELVIEASGPDAVEAVSALVELIMHGFHETEALE